MKKARGFYKGSRAFLCSVSLNFIVSIIIGYNSREKYEEDSGVHKESIAPRRRV